MAEESGGVQKEETDGDDAENQYREGIVLVTAGRYLEAIRAFERALEIRPREARYLTGLAAAVDRLDSFHTPSVLQNRPLLLPRVHRMPGSSGVSRSTGWETTPARSNALAMP